MLFCVKARLRTRLFLFCFFFFKFFCCVRGGDENRKCKLTAISVYFWSRFATATLHRFSCNLAAILRKVGVMVSNISYISNQNRAQIAVKSRLAYICDFHLEVERNKSATKIEVKNDLCKRIGINKLGLQV